MAFLKQMLTRARFKLMDKLNKLTCRHHPARLVESSKWIWCRECGKVIKWLT